MRKDQADIEKLIREYRPSMPVEVLHLWAKDVVSVLSSQRRPETDQAEAPKAIKQWRHSGSTGVLWSDGEPPAGVENETRTVYLTAPAQAEAPKADDILDHKWLDPECGIQGCQSLVWKARYEAAVKGRSEFRQAYRAARAATPVPAQAVVDEAFIRNVWEYLHGDDTLDDVRAAFAAAASISPHNPTGE